MERSSGIFNWNVQVERSNGIFNWNVQVERSSGTFKWNTFNNVFKWNSNAEFLEKESQKWMGLPVPYAHAYGQWRSQDFSEGDFKL